jgi:NAD(P)-dependent dehydrogenase (short-subunit alcohol dehydrogenase family)
VVLVARGAEELARTVEAIREAGGEAHGVTADVGDKRAAHAIAGTAAALVGPVDLLFQNASTLGHVPLRPLLDTDCEALERALEVPVVGPLRLAKLLVGPMALRGRGLVVNVTSDASVAAYAGWGAYGASKAALDQLGRVLAVELEGTGVRVVTVDPGEMRTQMHADALPNADPTTLLDPDVVAGRVLRLVREIERLPSGARVEASAWKDAEP